MSKLYAGNVYFSTLSRFVLSDAAVFVIVFPSHGTLHYFFMKRLKTFGTFTVQFHLLCIV
jgi:hypothetical protein